MAVESCAEAVETERAGRKAQNRRLYAGTDTDVFGRRSTGGCENAQKVLRSPQNVGRNCRTKQNWSQKINLGLISPGGCARIIKNHFSG